jgi:hypothetical protein
MVPLSRREGRMPKEGAISAEVVNRLMFGHHDRQRFTQETPVLPEVWHRYAAEPTKRHDVLITPFGSKSAVGLLRLLLEDKRSGQLRTTACSRRT